MSYRRKIITKSCILTTVFFLILFRACSIMEPPKLTEVERVFQAYCDDIQIVVDFMISSEYRMIEINTESSIGIKNTDEYYLETEEIILDQKTEEAAKHLLKGKYKCISKSENTIMLLQWRRWNDVGCGIAYSINGRDLPEVQHATELIPLKQEGWYYYVSDFNQWRAEQGEDLE